MPDIQRRTGLATEWLRRHFDAIPSTALVLGSGLDGWIDPAWIRQRIPYTEIPGFPRSTVKGHAGMLILAEVERRYLVILCGRLHLYEGYSAQEITLPARVLRQLGAERLILTNAAGALNPLFAAGGLMLITDHINMTGKNPLTGPNVEAWGPRFPDMSQVYSPELREKAMRAALSCGQRLEQGVYAGIAGPSLETPAETRMYRALGADAIGMSTVSEAIVARHMDMDVLGISCLTNKNLPDCMAPTSYEEILEQAGRSGAALGDLLCNLIPLL
ncbi:MAG: purine-nucleoside phosphorylase [Pseudomonadota bacterium]|nr:purine-nucleoside phosphorylase [Pseudomonadota bacterium]